MKKLAIFASALLFAVACQSDDNMDNNDKIILDFESLSQYIDTVQYGGNLLYSGRGYEWHDNTTDLGSSLTNYWQDGTFFGGGVVISNFINTKSNPNYEDQLSINGNPHSGSNFAICYAFTNECPPFIEFRNEAKQVMSLYIKPTAYLSDVVQNGNAFSAAMPKNGYIRVEATGIDVAGSTTGTAEFYLYDGRKESDWRLWELESLGAVKRIEFRMFEGTTDGDKRLDSTAEYPTYPSYFAIDDIAVER
ncbi:MAG: DUF4465 domain-containing protein [Alistipes sp.]|nr:DUF4465 domain-containing protein [Alistipes sp.]